MQRVRHGGKGPKPSAVVDARMRDIDEYEETDCLLN